MIMGIAPLIFLMAWISPKKNYRRVTLGSGITVQSEPSLPDKPAGAGAGKAAGSGSWLSGARWDVDDPYGLHMYAQIIAAVATLIALYFFRAEVLGWLADVWFGLSAQAGTAGTA